MTAIKRLSSQRTDPHRPGALIPGDYRPVLFYALATTQGGMPVPSYHIDCRREKARPVPSDSSLSRALAASGGSAAFPGQHAPGGYCCVAGLREIAKVTFAERGSLGVCTVCGSAFIEGEIWRHEPTGEHIHVGHICARKYELLADWSTDELEREKQKKQTAAEILKAKSAKERQAFLDEHPGLEDALKTEHRIVKDIASRFQTYRTLTDKQIALVLKIANEAKNPKPENVRPPSEWIGEVGKRIPLRVKIERIKPLHQDEHFTTYLHVMTDEHGNDIRWFGSTRLQIVNSDGTDLVPVEEGATVLVKATVKKHDIFDGRTIVSHVAQADEKKISRKQARLNAMQALQDAGAEHKSNPIGWWQDGVYLASDPETALRLLQGGG